MSLALVSLYTSKQLILSRKRELKKAELDDLKVVMGHLNIASVTLSKILGDDFLSQTELAQLDLDFKEIQKVLLRNYGGDL
jgi:hypothetical protein